MDFLYLKVHRSSTQISSRKNVDALVFNGL